MTDCVKNQVQPFLSGCPWLSGMCFSAPGIFYALQCLASPPLTHLTSPTSSASLLWQSSAYSVSTQDSALFKKIHCDTFFKRSEVSKLVSVQGKIVNIFSFVSHTLSLQLLGWATIWWKQPRAVHKWVAVYQETLFTERGHGVDFACRSRAQPLTPGLDTWWNHFPMSWHDTFKPFSYTSFDMKIMLFIFHDSIISIIRF